MLIKNNLSSVVITAVGVKEYFDVSVYRNVLDMLNTFDGVLNRWGMDLHDNTIDIYKYGTVFVNARTLKAANVGYAIKKVGQKHGWNEVFIYARKQLIKNNLKPLPPTWNNTQPLALAINMLESGNVRTTAHYSSIINKYMSLKGAYFNVEDLLGLARQINWELNRVRLPVPHNFRQINEKIQGRNYKGIGNYITLMQLLDVYGQLKLSIKTLRISVRKEIDAANLAKKVQEETLRLEQAALITRQKAEAEIEARRLIILAERKAALEKEFQEAEALKVKLSETRAKLEADFKTLEAAKQISTAQEIIEIDAKQNQVIDAIEKVEIVAIDKNIALETAKIAAFNVNKELVLTQDHQIETANIILDDLEQQKVTATPNQITVIERQQEQIIKQVETVAPIIVPPSNVNITLPESKALAPATEKSNLVPILLTVAAGVILT